MPHNYNPQFATGHLFMSYQSFVAALANVDSATFPRGMPNHYSAQGVEIKERSDVNVDGAKDQEPE